MSSPSPSKNHSQPNQSPLHNFNLSPLLKWNTGRRAPTASSLPASLTPPPPRRQIAESGDEVSVVEVAAGICGSSVEELNLKMEQALGKEKVPVSGGGGGIKIGGDKKAKPPVSEAATPSKLVIKLPLRPIKKDEKGKAIVVVNEKKGVVLEEKKGVVVEKQKAAVVVDAKKDFVFEANKVVVEKMAVVVNDKKGVVLEEKKNVVVEKQKAAVVVDAKKDSVFEANKAVVEKNKAVVVDENAKKDFIFEANKAVVVEKQKAAVVVDAKKDFFFEANKVVEKQKGVVVNEKKDFVLEPNNDVVVEKQKAAVVVDEKQDFVLEANKAVVVEKQKAAVVVDETMDFVFETNKPVVVEKNKAVVEEVQVKDVEGNEKVGEEVIRSVWNLRPRNKNKVKIGGEASEKGRLERKVGTSVGSGGEKKEKKKLSINVSLTRQEIEEDIYSFTGTKPARRPKKRPKQVQSQLNRLYPGNNLVNISTDSYYVSLNSLKKQQG